MHSSDPPAPLFDSHNVTSPSLVHEALFDVQVKVQRSFSFEELQSGSYFASLDESDLQFYRVYGQPVLIPNEVDPNFVVNEAHPPADFSSENASLHFHYPPVLSSKSCTLENPLSKGRYARRSIRSAPHPVTSTRDWQLVKQEPYKVMTCSNPTLTPDASQLYTIDQEDLPPSIETVQYGSDQKPPVHMYDEPPMTSLPYPPPANSASPPYFLAPPQLQSTQDDSHESSFMYGRSFQVNGRGHWEETQAFSTAFRQYPSQLYTGTRAIDLVSTGEGPNLRDASLNEHAGRTTRSLMEDIRSRFPHDLTGCVIRSGDFAFASGSCGDVYRGTFNMTERTLQVAIKTYKMYLQCDENLDKNIRRFRRETAVWLKLDHPNVLPLFGTVQDPRLHPKIPAMVCPWAENGTLSAYLERNNKLTVSRRIRLVDDVAQGLHYLHSQNVVHGDLSGSNVLVHADERACISDFGLATLLTHIGGSAFVTTRANNLKGTVRWMAPELFRVDGDTEAKTTTQSDVYSFGGIMLQILTNQIPYHYFKRDVQVIHAISMGEKPRRPDQAVVTESRWRFMEWCWCPADAAEYRPSSREIVAFTRKELMEALALESRAKASFVSSRCFYPKNDWRLPSIGPNTLGLPTF